MNSNDLFDIIGETPEKYVLDAAMTEAAPGRTLSSRRIWLIAAVIAVAALLVGCVAYALSVSDLVLGTYYAEDYRTGETEPRFALSLQGYTGSNGYLAAQEWFEWEKNYDPDYEIITSIDDKNTGIPEEYISYNCYTQEMKDKIDEICEKYDLKLLGMTLADTSADNMFGALQIPGILREDVQAEVNFGQGEPGYFFQNGTFKVECYVTLTGENNPWPYENLISFRCHNKDYFCDVTIGIDDISKYEQWNYTTSYGVDTLLVMGEESALIVVDIGDYFITVTGIETQAGNIIDGEHSMTRKGLEAYAEAFDFTIRPQPLTDAQVAEVNARYEARWAQINAEMEKSEEEFQEYLGRASYEARVSFHLQNDTEAVRMGYTFYDFDGNGVEELVIGRDGYIQYIYTEVDGETAGILGWPQMGATYLATDGTLVNIEDSTYRFFHVENGERVSDYWVERRAYWGPTEESPWRLCYGVDDDRPITEDEYYEYCNSKKRVVLVMKPLTDYPLPEPVPYNTDGKDITFYCTEDTYEDLIRTYILNPIEIAPGVFRESKYALTDLDGDGREELIVDEEEYQAVYTMADGKMLPMYSGQELNICKGNIIQIIHSYPGETKVYCHYRMSGTKGEMVEYLRYDPDRNPQNPWFRSTDCTGQDISLEPISKLEFDKILSRYSPIELDWKLVEEYPLP